MIYLDHNATTPVLPEVFEALRLLLDQAGICAISGSACLADSPGIAAKIDETITTMQRCVVTLGGTR